MKFHKKILAIICASALATTGFQLFSGNQIKAAVFSTPSVTDLTETTSTIWVPKNFDSLIKNLISNLLSSKHSYLNSKVDSQIKKAANQQEGHNKFIASPADLKTLVNTTHMTSSQQKQVTEYVVNLINSIRKTTGTHKVYATSGAITFANQIANGYNKDKWDFAKQNNTHDCFVINSVAKKDHLAYVINVWGAPGTGLQDYEDISEGYLPQQKTISMAALKQGIYNTIIDMMFNDGGTLKNGKFDPGEAWGHALDLTGYSLTQQLPEYVGLSIDQMGQIHIEMIVASDILPSTNLPNLTQPLK